MHRWLVRYEGDGLEGLNNRLHRPAQSPHQMPPPVEAMVLEMRRSHPYWGARRIAFELVRKRVERAPSIAALSPRIALSPTRVRQGDNRVIGDTVCRAPNAQP
jgi:hypothetical protein